MNAQKQATDPAQGKLPTERKAWKKKSPVEVVLAQLDRLRDDVAKKEEEYKQAKRQLQKLEEARKVLEAS
jgi:hypothetical protein